MKQNLKKEIEACTRYSTGCPVEEMNARIRFWQRYDGTKEVEKSINKSVYNGTKTQQALLVLMAHPEIIGDVREIAARRCYGDLRNTPSWIRVLPDRYPYYYDDCEKYVVHERLLPSKIRRYTLSVKNLVDALPALPEKYAQL